MFDLLRKIHPQQIKWNGSIRSSKLKPTLGFLNSVIFVNKGKFSILGSKQKNIIQKKANSEFEMKCLLYFAKLRGNIQISGVAWLL